MASTSDPDRSPSASHDDEDQSKEKEATGSAEAPKKPSLPRRVWAALALDPPTIITMAKGALPPIISLAALRSFAFAHKYTTLGYLVAIMSLLGFAIMPRAKFVQNMVLNIVRPSPSCVHTIYLSSLLVAFRLHWRCRRPTSVSNRRSCQEGHYSCCLTEGRCHRRVRKPRSNCL